MTLATKPLSVELKTATAQAHDQAEHSEFMSQLMEGKLDINAFIALQQQSWLFYSALEEAVAVVRANGFATELLDPALDRKATLAADLEKLSGADWQDKIVTLPATKEYISRLEEIRDTQDGPRVLAHHYVRYLGDLSGGQVIARMMQRHYNAPTDALSFYSFDEIGKLKPYKDAYRAKLDALVLTEEERGRLLLEAGDAFMFNYNLFANLG